MTLVNLSKEEIQLCKDFSKNVDTSFYASRNQWNAAKREKDSFIGKLGEIVVFNYFKAKDIALSYPDVQIYSARNKSWAPDLSNEEYNIHVKTQDVEQGTKYGVSWMFQKNDKEINNPSSKDYIALVTLDTSTDSGEIKAILPVQFLHDNDLFKEPKLEKLKQSKMTIYLKDLPKKCLYL